MKKKSKIAVELEKEIKTMSLERRILLERFISKWKDSDWDIEDMRRDLRFLIKLRNASSREVRKKIFLQWFGFYLE